MGELPLLVRCLLAAALAATIVWAFFGRAPRRCVPVRAVVWTGSLGVACYAAAALAVAFGRGEAALLMAFAVEGLCATVWLARGVPRDEGEDDDGGGGGGRPKHPTGPSPIDWEQFDRDRAAWSRRTGSHPRPPERVA
ncbi:MAG: hypothetical protein JHC95_11985 [Solirubrobacteraceae bacterium]|nr:hypothetical protein [Solirubrobacteraceae bacterium]